MEIAAGWQKRLQGKAEIPIEKVHIHVQVVNLSTYPNWKARGLAQYFRLGKPVAEPRDYVEGRFDAVLIHLFADPDMTPEELEELVCHEIVHIAFPNSGGNRKMPFTASLEEFFSDSASEEWVEKKTKELLHEYGCVFRERI